MPRTRGTRYATTLAQKPAAKPSLLVAGAYVEKYPRGLAQHDAATGRHLLGVMRGDGSADLLHYDPNTKRITEQQFGGTLSSGTNNHNVVGLTRLASGRVVAVRSGHNEQLYTRRCGAFDGRIGSQLQPVLTVNGSCTYPFLAQMNDTEKTLYCEYRWLTIGAPNEWRRQTVTSTNGGLTWGSPVTWLVTDGGGTTQRPYPMLCRRTGTSRVDFLTTNGHWGEVSDMYLATGYWEVDSGGTRTWYQSDGTLLGDDTDLPFEPQDFTVLAPSEAGVANFAWVDLAWVDGVLTALWSRMTPYASPTQVTFYLSRLVGGEWETEEVADGGPHTPVGLYGAFNAAGGGCLNQLDRNAVYLSRRYSAVSIRLEKWQRNSATGTWYKAVDVSGETGDYNHSPVWLEDSPTEQIFYTKGTITSDTSWTGDVWAYPAIEVAANPSGVQVKPTSPVLNTTVRDRLYPGLRFFVPFTEGSGTAAADLSGNGYTGTLNGALTWEAGDLGPMVTSFSSGRYISHLIPSQPIADGTYPFWTIAVYSITGTTAGDVFSLGNSADNIQWHRQTANGGGTPGNVGLNTRGGIGTGVGANTNVGVNDGEFHVHMTVWFSATEAAHWFDGEFVAAPSGTLSPLPTFNRMTTGAYSGTTYQSPAVGVKVVAVLGGKGGVPDPVEAWLDLSTGAFEALRG